MSNIQDILFRDIASATATANRVIVRDACGATHCGCGNVTEAPDTAPFIAPFVPCSICLAKEAQAYELNTTKGALCDAHGAELGSAYDTAMPQPFADAAQAMAAKWLPLADNIHAPFHFVWNYNDGGGYGRPFALTGTGQWLLATLEREGRYPIQPATL